MNILMILSHSSDYDPRIFNEARSLINAGNKVTILEWKKKNQKPSQEVKQGINIIRSVNTKFMNFLPYDILRMHRWWVKGYNDAVELHKKQAFDVVHCHDFDTLPIGVKLKKKLGLSLIYDARELWGYMVKRDLPFNLGNYYLLKEKKLIPYVDGFIIAEEKYAEYYKSFTLKKLTTIMNSRQLISQKYTPPKNEFTLLFIGRLSSARFVLELTEVVKGLKSVKCIIGGVGKPEYVNILKQKCREAKNIDFIGKIPFEKVIPYTKKSTLVISMIDPDSFNNKIAMANKQHEAMICGRPIICTKDTRSGEITEHEKCGLVVDYTIEALRAAIIRLRDSPKLCEELGKNALKAAIDKYNWAIEEKKLLMLYESLKGENKR